MGRRTGRITDPRGYVLLRMNGHRLADVRGYVYEHRLEAEKMLRRALKPGEVVHHKNNNKSDNRWENLEVCASRSEHQLHHGGASPRVRRRRAGQPNVEIDCLCGCGAKFLKYDKWRRPRTSLPGHLARARAKSAVRDAI